ncbi:MAG: SMP-30/gluconolactonase/LRE family protein [Alphaproteobacteria bacterium]|nr:MAG: SMP-30/gluconolactonase/LRE family protein [Alphaproteobacteria bacterium]
MRIAISAASKVRSRYSSIAISAWAVARSGDKSHCPTKICPREGSLAEYQARCVLAAKAELGECPLWSVEEQCLYWIDIYGKTFNRFDPATGQNRAWDMPANPGSFVLREEGGVVIAMRDGIYSFDCGDEPPVKLMNAPYDPGEIRFNDGRTDRQGRYWVGSMPLGIEEENAGVVGAFYSYDGSTLIKRITPVHHANGTAFSLDSRTMYRSETTDRKIFAYDYDAAAGTVSNERLFATVPPELGMPDGATVDSEDGYWSALPAGPNGGSIARFAPDGKLDLVIDLPVLIGTMPAFGGPDMSTLYVTTGQLEPVVGKPVTALSGNIFAIETKFRGVPEVKLRSK